MLTATKKYGSLALVTVVSAWLLYVAVGSTSFQICVANKENKQPEQASEKHSSEVLHSLIVSARVKTYCACVFLYDRRDAITAIATAFIALFTLTLWLATTEQGRLTTKAIELTRKEFIATHRPRMIVRFIQGPFDDAESHQFIWVTIVNIGVNPATVEAFGCDLARRNSMKQ
ncbi:MAG: hypothetical protein WBW81_16840 [Methylocella sp.]